MKENQGKPYNGHYKKAYCDTIESVIMADERLDDGSELNLPNAVREAILESRGKGYDGD